MTPIDVPADLSARFTQRGGALFARSIPWRTVEPGDDEYPDRLLQVSKPPARLWIAGRPLNEAPVGIAIIGSRRANGYGLDIARRLGGDFGAGGVGVISGLALGADGAAHDGALSAGGWTIGVLGCGIDVCYPASNARLYLQIAEHGTLVSESDPGATPTRWSLSERNRIIAGLAVAVIVVQAAVKSGTLGTVAYAKEAGREILAVPGNVDWPQSAGVHGLIRDGAKICTGIADLSDEMRLLLRLQTVVDRDVPSHLPDAQRAVLAVLSQGAATKESVCVGAGLDAITALRAISALEVAGFVGDAPGGCIRRTR